MITLPNKPANSIETAFAGNPLSVRFWSCMNENIKSFKI